MSSLRRARFLVTVGIARAQVQSGWFGSGTETETPVAQLL